MAHDGNRLLPIEWIGSTLWVVFWAVLAYIAISEQSISLGGRLGITHSEGLAAITHGFVMLGASLVGVAWMLRLHPFKRLWHLLLFLAWLCGVIVYFAFVYS